MIYYISNEVDGLIGFKYNSYYEKNVQGDIIAIRDNMNNIVAKYTYDTWGNILSITDSNDNNITDTTHIGYINPYRYRSYYYDTETNLYYLNSRYYNPVWGRFINADGIVGANQDILSYNLYAYCSNNPVNCSDTSGHGSADLIAQSIARFTSEAASNAKLASKENVIRATNKPTNTFRKVDNPKCSSTISYSKFDKLTSKSTPTNGHGNLPLLGEPNSTGIKSNGDLRHYGPDGRAQTDTDYSHPERHPDLDNPHKHDWTWGRNGDNPKRGPAYNSRTTENIMKGAAVIGTGYLIYRGIRMIPSFFPAFWWTLPINAATP